MRNASDTTGVKDLVDRSDLPLPDDPGDDGKVLGASGGVYGLVTPAAGGSSGYSQSFLLGGM